MTEREIKILTDRLIPRPQKIEFRDGNEFLICDNCMVTLKLPRDAENCAALAGKADEEKTPRFTDPLHAIAVIYEILGENERAIETYGRMIACIKDEWGYKDGDAAVLEVEREIARISKEK